MRSSGLITLIYFFWLTGCSHLQDSPQRKIASIEEVKSCTSLLSRLIHKNDYLLKLSANISNYQEFVKVINKLNYNLIISDDFLENLYMSPYFRDLKLTDFSKSHLKRELALYIHPGHPRYNLSYLLKSIVEYKSSDQVENINSIFNDINISKRNSDLLKGSTYHPLTDKDELEYIAQNGLWGIDSHRLLSRIVNDFNELNINEITDEQLDIIHSFSQHGLQSKKSLIHNLENLAYVHIRVPGESQIPLSVIENSAIISELKILSANDLHQIMLDISNRFKRNEVTHRKEISGNIEYYIVSYYKEKSKEFTKTEDVFDLINDLSVLMSYFPNFSDRAREVILKNPLINSFHTEESVSLSIRLGDFLDKNGKFNNRSIHGNKKLFNFLRVSLMGKDLVLEKAAVNTRVSLEALEVLYLATNKGLLKKKKFQKAFLKSPWVKRLGIKEDQLEGLYAKLNEFDNISRGELKQIFEETFEVFKGKKSFSLVRADKELDTLKVKTQRGWGACWKYAHSTLKEVEINQKLGAEVELSPQWSYIQYIISQTQDQLARPNSRLRKRGVESFELDEANYSATAVVIDSLYGVVPAKAFEQLSEWFVESADEFKVFLKKLLSHSIVAIDSASPESLTSEIRKQQLYLRERIEWFYSIQDQEFTFNGKQYTPKSFVQDYTPLQSKGLVGRVLDSPLSNPDSFYQRKFISPSGETRLESVDIQYVSVDISSYLNFIKVNIDKGNPLILNYKIPRVMSGVNGSFRSDKTISIEPGTIEPPKFFGFGTDSAHSVAIIGYELDINGEIKYIKAINSWGHHSGEEGYIYLDRDYIRKYALDVFISK